MPQVKAKKMSQNLSYRAKSNYALPEEDQSGQKVNFWDRKGVIKLDPKNEDRCSHTIVPPSTMMTLAMELQVSNRGKASRIFKQAKRKADEKDLDADTEDTRSRLSELWVVPDAGDKTRSNGPAMASHLQPSLANVDFVFRPGSCSPEQPQRANLRYPNDMEPDERKLLENITVADLVGSEDHVVHYLDSEVNNRQKDRDLKTRKNRTLPTDSNIGKSSEVQRNSRLVKRIDQNHCDREDFTLSSEHHQAPPKESSPECVNSGRMSPINNTLGVDSLTSDDCQALLVAKCKDTEGHDLRRAIDSGNEPRTGRAKNTPTDHQGVQHSNNRRDNLSIAEGTRGQLSCGGSFIDFGDHSSCRAAAASGETEKQVSNTKNSKADASSKDSEVSIASDLVEDLNRVPDRNRTHSLSQPGNQSGQGDTDRWLTPDFSRSVSQSGTATPQPLTSSSLSSSLFSLSSFGSLSSSSVGLSLASSAVPSSIHSNDTMGSDGKSQRVANSDRSMTSSVAKPRLTATGANTSMPRFATVEPSKDVVTASSRGIINSPTSCAVVNSSFGDETCQYRRNGSPRASLAHCNNSSAEAKLESSWRHDDKRLYPGRDAQRESRCSNRKVIFEYAEQAPAGGTERSSPTPGKGVVVSKAVFPDQTDATLARPVLHIKNKRSVCKNCGRPAMEDGASLMLCCWCCRKKPIAPPRRDSRRVTKKFLGAEQQATDSLVEIPAETRRSSQTSYSLSSSSSPASKRNLDIKPAQVQPEYVEAPVSVQDEQTSLFSQLPDRNKKSISSSFPAEGKLQGEIARKAPLLGCRITLDPSRKPNSGNCVVVTNVVSECEVIGRADHSLGLDKPVASCDANVTRVNVSGEAVARDTNQNTNPRVTVVDGSKIKLVKPDSNRSNKRSGTDKQKELAHGFGSTDSIMKRSEQKGLVDEVLRAIDESMVVRPYGVTQQQKPQATIPVREKAPQVDSSKKQVGSSSSLSARPASTQSLRQPQKPVEETVSRQECSSLSAAKVQKSGVVSARAAHKSKSQPVQPTDANHRLESNASDSLDDSLTRKVNKKPTHDQRQTFQKSNPTPVANGAEVTMRNRHAADKSPAVTTASMHAQDARASPSLYSSQVTLSLRSSTNDTGKSKRSSEATSANRDSASSQPPAVTLESKPPLVQMQPSPDYKKWQGQSPKFQETSIQTTPVSLNHQTQDKVKTQKTTPASGRLFTRHVGHIQPQVVCVAAEEKTSPTKKGYEKVCITYSKDGLRKMPEGQAKHYQAGTKEEISPKMVAPPHTVTDDEEFSGVVEPPPMKVKEIRAMFKRGPDYQNYAKPRTLSSGSNIPAPRKSSVGHRTASGSHSDAESFEDMRAPNTKVAKQVMGLFKGALEIEKDLEVFEEETLRNQQELTTSSDLSNSHSPSNRNGHVTADADDEAQKETFVPPKSPGKLSTSWPPTVEEDGASSPPSDIKSSVARIKNESEAVESFDESLDEFYDVLNDLTS